jgi:hypothetical protein
VDQAQAAKKSPEPASETLLEWTSKAWPFIKRSPEFFRTILVIAGLLVLIAIFMKEFLTVLVIVTLVFVVYVLGTVPPAEITHKVTNTGLRSGEHFYPWEQLTRFWFGERSKHDILFVETTLRFPRRLILILDGVDQKKLRGLLKKKLELVEEPEPGLLDKSARYLAEKIPLESERP